MSDRRLRFILMILVCALLMTPQPHAWGASSLLSVDFAKLASRGDLNYAKAPARSEEGLPIGNGRMGTLLWTEGSALKMQINRVDVFGNNTASVSFPTRNTDYCGGCAFVDLDLGGAGVFGGENATQHLSIGDGLATINGAGVKIESLAWNEKDVIAARISGAGAAGISAKLRSLRPAVVKTAAHKATSKAVFIDDVIILTQTFEEGEYYCGTAVALKILGAATNVKLDTNKSYRDDLVQEIQLAANPANGPATVLIASAASMDRKDDVTATAMENLKAAEDKGFKGMYESNKKWWADFYGKAFVHLHSADYIADFVESEYSYFLYTMGCCSLGKYPFKFNGMLWCTGGDKRAWGTQFWGANQSCFYNCMFPLNRPELMKPMFDMYTGMADSLGVAAKQQWGSKGIWIPETVSFDGLAPLPDDIAAEMQDLYLLKKPWSEASAKFKEYCSHKSPHSSRYNWMAGANNTERGGGPYGPVTHIFSRGAKIAYQYWMQYEYTMDKGWLKERAYPMIKGIAEFYRNYPNLVKESDGKYHIYFVNDNEPLWGGRDTSEEISAMMGIFPVAIKASEMLGVDEDLRAQWKEVLDHLAPLPTRELAATTITMSIKRYPMTAPPRGGAPGAGAGAGAGTGRKGGAGRRGGFGRGGRGNMTATSQTQTTTVAAAGGTNAAAGQGQNGQPGRGGRGGRGGGAGWIKGLPPSVNGATFGGPDGNTTPQWFFDLCNLESDNPEMLKMAAATYPGGSGEGARVGVLSKAAVTAAIMGRAEDFKNLVVGQLHPTEGSLQGMANRMTLKEGAQCQDNEQEGRAADAIQTALIQSAPAGPAKDPVIRVFPAWPKDWDADFTLLCRGAFLVSSTMQGGKIGFVEIESKEGGKCQLRNPWGEDKEVTLFRNGNQGETLSGALIKFNTEKGERVVVALKGETPKKREITF